MKEFNREDRYMVVKLSKLNQKKLYTGAFVDYSVESEIERIAGHALVDCVVVESDWPEYERVWKMIEKRVNGTQANTDQKALDTASEIMQLLDKPMPYGQLKAKIQCILIELLEENLNEK